MNRALGAPGTRQLGSLRGAHTRLARINFQAVLRNPNLLYRPRSPPRAWRSPFCSSSHLPCAALRSPLKNLADCRSPCACINIYVASGRGQRPSPASIPFLVPIAASAPRSAGYCIPAPPRVVSQSVLPSACAAEAVAPTFALHRSVDPTCDFTVNCTIAVVVPSRSDVPLFAMVDRRLQPVPCRWSVAVVTLLAWCGGSIMMALALTPDGVALLQWLDGNSMSGSIPPEIGNLSSLAMFSISFNNFSGEVPWTQLFNCKNLVQLWLNVNNFTGDVTIGTAAFLHSIL